MIASSLVLANLLYVVGAIVLAVLISLVVVIRHRKPKSVEANMASFNRGLRALAPDAPGARRPPPNAAPVRAEPKPRSVHPVGPSEATSHPVTSQTNASTTEAEAG